jgi:hypothetical protein
MWVRNAKVVILTLFKNNSPKPMKPHRTTLKKVALKLIYPPPTKIKKVFFFSIDLFIYCE